MRVEEFTQSWQVTNAKELAAAMTSRDEKGGALFFMTPNGEQQYPSLTIRVTKNYADVHYFPLDGHPGFRCLGGAGLPKGGWTSFGYQDCDPGTGEETPNEFVIPIATACEIAEEFLRSGQRSNAVLWLEL